MGKSVIDGLKTEAWTHKLVVYDLNSQKNELRVTKKKRMSIEETVIQMKMSRRL